MRGLPQGALAGPEKVTGQAEFLGHTAHREVGDEHGLRSLRLDPLGREGDLGIGGGIEARNAGGVAPTLAPAVALLREMRCGGRCVTLAECFRF